MAVCTHRVTTADTGVSPNTSGAFTPALNDLLVVFVVASQTISAGSALTSSVGGFTFTKIDSAAWDTNVDIIEVWVSDALVSSATSQTVSWQNSSDQSTGTNIAVFSVSGMSKTGSDASRQTAKQENQAGATPAPVFGSACLTTNPTLGCIGVNDPTPNLTPPTDWTEASDTGYTSPDTGIETVFRDSGFTGTTVTWGSSTSPANFGSLMIELDAGSVGDPFFTQLDAAYI